MHEIYVYASNVKGKRQPKHHNGRVLCAALAEQRKAVTSGDFTRFHSII